LVDRGWGGEMLAFLPLFAAIPLACMGSVTTLWAYLALWALIGVAQAGMYYETCFAFLTRRLGDCARGAISQVTLVAGFAGTIAFPLGHYLGSGVEAEWAFVVFAGMIAVLVPPTSLWAVGRLRSMARAEARQTEDPAELADHPIRLAIGKRAFWALAAMFGALMLNHAILLTFALILFRDRGADPATAALAASCFGPAQVLGRLVLIAAGARVGNGLATGLSVLALAIAGAVLTFGHGIVALVFVFAALQGAGIGVLSIMRPVLIADYLGRSGFGAVSGAIAIAPVLAAALGPFVGARLLTEGGADLAIAVAFVLALVGAGAGLYLARLPREMLPGRTD
jgi:Na+/melibiose symporter-like transporter